MAVALDRTRERTRPVLPALALLAAGLAPDVGAEAQRTDYSAVELIAEQASLPAAGGTVTLGFHLAPIAGWHAYWSNPGDAGKEASMRWALPDGFEPGALRFPAPKLIPFGAFNTYGFDGAVLLLADIAVPPGLEPGRRFELAGRASWVVCDDALCVPEQAQVAVTLAVGEGLPAAANAARFAAARAQLPMPVDWSARFAVVDDGIDFTIDTPAGQTFDSPYLFVAEKRLVRYGEQTSQAAPGSLRFSMAAGSAAEQLLETAAVLRDGDADSVALIAQADGSAGASDPRTAESGDSANAAAGGTDALAFAQAILFGLLGGVILNLMPCVFPILSMKALGLMSLADSARSTARASGLCYAAGILLAFALAALALIALRAGGAAAGWGFQLQSWWVNVILGLAMVAIGLNLAGVFEIGTRLMGLGQSLTAGKLGERQTAFLTGLLAVVVATPCTAPFMAGALGYALAQPAPVALAVFLALGLGLALPYLALTFVPGLGRALPRPGPWMASFRRLLAFPMLATALWLFWIVGQQLGATSMAVALLTALLLAFALWAYGHSVGKRPLAWRLAAIAGLAACVAAGVRVGDVRLAPQLASDDAADGSAQMLGKLALQPFTPERVQGYVDANRPVFVYFTADWCITCKVNERVALATDAVGELFDLRDIQTVVGDWTTEDPAITEWLAKYDRAGVPLYLYFPRGSALDAAVVLPQILLPGIVVAAVEDADDAAGDYALVQAYIDADTAWHALAREITESDADEEEKERRRQEELGDHPDIAAAAAAAQTIVGFDGRHERTVDAAVFLIEHTTTAELMALGAATLERLAPDRDDWPILLRQIDFYAPPGASATVEDLFERFANEAPNPVHRATARYYQASRQMRRANDADTDPIEAERARAAALALATGLSAGVENETFATSRDSARPTITLAQAEADLLHTFARVSVGGTLPDVAATRLDGADERFSAYANQVVLLDFWATWCSPCVQSLPQLRELAAKLPDERFEILSISVDEDRRTVADFQADEPMPWANWHIGPDSEILKSWVIRGYPTYLLVDADGTILARTHKLDANLESLIERTVAEAAG